jgi:hypothetical protein
MSIAPIYSLLAASGTVTAIVGTNPVRIYPAGNIPQVEGQDPNANLPCITWQMIGGYTENLLDERPPADHQRLQLDCWTFGDTGFDDAETLASAAQAALELHGYCVSINGHDYDEVTKRYRSSFDWSFIVAH